MGSIAREVLTEDVTKVVITLEGIPAVGKSTVAKLLEEEHDYIRVPEVNELFPERPIPEPLNWYASKQLERNIIAMRHQKSILDGDIFQVAWLSWIFPERGFINFADSLEFFLRNTNSIQIPSFFVYLSVTDEIRYEREKEREARRGHNHQQFLNKYKRYENMYYPQRALFESINNEYPGLVLFLNNVNSEESVKEIIQKGPQDIPSTSEFITWLNNWLSHNSAVSFSANVL